MKLITQKCRMFCQIIILGIWAFGLYYKLTSLTLVLLGATLIFGNFFCGWACPFGAAQDFIGKLGYLFVKSKLKMPYKIQKYLKYSRYIVFGLILLEIAPRFIYDINGYTSFLFSIYDIFDDAFIFNFANIIMISYLVIALFFDRPFCNYLCSEGAKFGLANITRIFSIKRNSTKCINCNICNKNCPQNIIISTKKHIRDIQCINCMKCITSCPIKGTLKYQYTGWKK